MNVTRIVDEYGPEVGAIATLIYVAAIEMVCGFSSDDYAVACVARPAAGSFLILAVLITCCIVRFEQRRSAKEHHER